MRIKLLRKKHRKKKFTDENQIVEKKYRKKFTDENQIVEKKYKNLSLSEQGPSTNR